MKKQPETDSHFHALVNSPLDDEMTQCMRDNEKRLGRKLTDTEKSEIASHYLTKASRR